MSTGEGPSPDTLRWHAEQLVRMHQDEPDEHGRPATGCKDCTPQTRGSCERLVWARAELERTEQDGPSSFGVWGPLGGDSVSGPGAPVL